MAHPVSIKRVTDLYEYGYSIRMIAELLDTSRDRVHRILKAKGIQMRPMHVARNSPNYTGVQYG